MNSLDKKNFQLLLYPFNFKIFFSCNHFKKVVNK